MEQKKLDELTMEQLAALDFEGDKQQPVESEGYQTVKAALKMRTGVRAGKGWPPSSAAL